MFYNTGQNTKPIVVLPWSTPSLIPELAVRAEVRSPMKSKILQPIAVEISKTAI